MVPVLLNIEAMIEGEKNTVWLVDSEDYLARLLHLKLAPLRISIRHLKPADIETVKSEAGQPIAKPPSDGLAVIVSLPQPGRSSRKLLSKIEEVFPDVPRIKLVSRDHLPSDTHARSEQGDEHSFYKPVFDWSRLLRILKKADSHRPKHPIQTGTPG